MAYLSELHPEVFMVSPRPGGLANIKRHDFRLTSKPSSHSGRNISRRSSKATLRSNTRKTTSKVTIKSTATGASAFSASFVKKSSTPIRTTREYRIKKILSSSPWLLFEDDDEEDPITANDPTHDAMTILSVAVSTIMLMAAGYRDIPRDHLVWTLSYLECVKDDFGFHPPNVRGILNNIKLIDNNLTSLLAEWEDDDNPDEVAGLTIAGPATSATGSNAPPE